MGKYIIIIIVIITFTLSSHHSIVLIIIVHHECNSSSYTHILIVFDHTYICPCLLITYAYTHLLYICNTNRQFSTNADTYMYINVSVRNYFNAEVEGYQSSHPAVNIRSLQSASVWFWGWKWDMKTPIENIDPRSYVIVEVCTYQKAVEDLTSKQSSQLSPSPVNNHNNSSKTNTKTSAVALSDNITNQQQHHSPTQAAASPGENDKSRNIDCCWGVFVLDIPKLKYFSSSMIAVQPYPIPSPLNPTSRSNLSSHDYSKCLHVDIMLSKKEIDS